MYEQAYYEQARALAKRVWDEFQREIAGVKQPLFYPELTADEVETVRDAYRSYTSEGIDLLSDSFTVIWGKDGFVFLAYITYARYATQRGVGFWEGLSLWVTGSPNEIEQVREYRELRRFFSRHNLPLEKNGTKHLYVTSLYMHARVTPKHVHRIVRVLAKIIDRFPFFLDEDLLYQVVKEFVEEMSGQLLIEEYRYLLRDEDNDDQTGNLNLSTIASLFQYLPNSLLFAGLRNKEATVRELIPLYEIVERIVLSDSDGIPDDVGLTGLWQLKEPVSEIAKEIMESAQVGHVVSRRRDPMFIRFRTPTVFFNFERSSISLFFPEQRLDTETRAELPVTLDSASRPSLRTQMTVPVYTAGGIWRLTEESTVSLPRYTDDLSVKFTTSVGETKEFFITDRWLLLDTDGFPVKGIPTPGSDVYVLVEESVDFECSGSELEFDGSDVGFRLHHLFLERNTVFFVDGKPIAPCLDHVPAFSVDEQYRVTDAYVTLEKDDKDRIPVYREFPALSFRVPEDVDASTVLSLIINGSRVSYDVRRDAPVADGSGERLIEIFPFSFALRAGAGIYVGEIAGVPDSFFRFVVLHNLTFEFENRLSTDLNRPKVIALSFDDSENSFTRNYEFPSKSDTTRFRLRLGETDCRLHVQPHHVSWTFSDGSSVPVHVSLSAVADKEIMVRHTAGSCRVVATPSDGSIPTFPVTSRRVEDGVLAFPLRTLQNVRSGNIALSIVVSHSSWGKMAFERVDICTVHTSFEFLDGPKTLLNTGESVLSKHLALGYNVSYQAIGDGRSRYLLSVIDRSGNAVVTVEVYADGEQYDSYLKDIIADGRYSFRVVRSRRLMGRTESVEEVVFTGKSFALRGGSVKDADDMTGEVFRCVEAVQDALLRSGRRLSVKRPVENFYLRITDAVSENHEDFLADGFFFLDGREQHHYDHNPYRLRVLERNGAKIKLRISDADGAGIRVDRHKHVNSRSGDTQLQTHKIVVVSDMEGGRP
jgi:hypothetical protein